MESRNLKNKGIKLINADCLAAMQGIKTGSIDAVITDPPYGTTSCKWDVIIPFGLMWRQLNRIIKPGGAIVLFGSEPFSSLLRVSNLSSFKYDWIWEKQKAANFMSAKYQPLKYHEIISVFNARGVYNPQKYEVTEIADILQMSKSAMIKYHKNRDFDKFGVVDRRKTINDCLSNKDLIGSKVKRTRSKDEGTRHPKSVLKINKEARNSHPTQKPISLMEYLIKTYTSEGETVLDFTMGSGSTGVAAVNLNRKFTGIEKDRDYFSMSSRRIQEALLK